MNTEASSPCLELVILVGLQGSGKTTFYDYVFAPTHQIVSKDRMPNARCKATKQEELIHSALSAGRSVVIDNTNPTPEDRKRICQLGKAYGARVIACYFPPDLALNLERNRARLEKERVPDVALYATAKIMQAPAFTEGFDEVWTVQPKALGEYSLKRHAEVRTAESFVH